MQLHLLQDKSVVNSYYSRIDVAEIYSGKVCTVLLQPLPLPADDRPFMRDQLVPNGGSLQLLHINDDSLELPILPYMSSSDIYSCCHKVASVPCHMVNISKVSLTRPSISICNSSDNLLVRNSILALFRNVIDFSRFQGVLVAYPGCLPMDTDTDGFDMPSLILNSVVKAAQDFVSKHINVHVSKVDNSRKLHQPIVMCGPDAIVSFYCENDPSDNDPGGKMVDVQFVGIFFDETMPKRLLGEFMRNVRRKMVDRLNGNGITFSYHQESDSYFFSSSSESQYRMGRNCVLRHHGYFCHKPGLAITCRGRRALQKSQLNGEVGLLEDEGACSIDYNVISSYMSGLGGIGYAPEMPKVSSMLPGVQIIVDEVNHEAVAAIRRTLQVPLLCKTLDAALYYSQSVDVAQAGSRGEEGLEDRSSSCASLCALCASQDTLNASYSYCRPVSRHFLDDDGNAHINPKVIISSFFITKYNNGLVHGEYDIAAYLTNECLSALFNSRGEPSELNKVILNLATNVSDLAQCVSDDWLNRPFAVNAKRRTISDIKKTKAMLIEMRYIAETQFNIGVPEVNNGHINPVIYTRHVPAQELLRIRSNASVPEILLRVEDINEGKVLFNYFVSYIKSMICLNAWHFVNQGDVYTSSLRPIADRDIARIAVVRGNFREHSSRGCCCIS